MAEAIIIVYIILYGVCPILGDFKSAQLNEMKMTIETETMQPL